MNEVIAIPGWAWVIFGSVLSVMAGIIAWMVGNFMKRAQEDIARAERVTCPGHQASFQRIHDEREKATAALNIAIKDLGDTIVDLKILINGLSNQLSNMIEKHDFNRESIVDLNRRVVDIEKSTR